MKFGRIFLYLFICLLIPVRIFAAESETAAKEEGPGNWGSIEYELDAYYSNVGLYLNLTDQQIPDIGEAREMDVYKHLLFSSLIPRFLVLEAAVFPMPGLGVYLKDNARNFYDNGEITKDINIIKAITAGFQEPYAFSVFLGNVISFSRPGEQKRQGNFGYMGYLISVGDYHIKDNALVKDDWVELEWKVKGDRKFSTHTLHWSFRAGGKFHSNREVTDVVYLAMRRSRVDFQDSSYLIDNSGFEYRIDFDSKTLEPVRHLLTVDKNWPVKSHKFGFSLSLGFLWESEKLYTGSLQDRDQDDFQLILRPNLVF